MTTKTYYGKLDCYCAPAAAENVTNEYYKSFVDFMSYLTASNVATLVSWNSGSGALSGSFNERTYWNGAKPFGLGAFSLWRMHSTSQRNWDWYFYTQVVSASTNIGFTFTTPITGYGTADDLAPGYSYVRGIYMQAAICVSGTTSFNPWNGSISDGNGNASVGAGNGGIRWVSGSDNRQLYVLPRSNDVGGAHATSKANGIRIGVGYANTYTSNRAHFLYDGDAILVCNEPSSASLYGLSYVGPFELNAKMTGSGLCGSDYGFAMITVGSVLSTDPNTINLAVNIGGIAGTNQNGTNPPGAPNGGMVVPVGNMKSGSKDFITNILATFPEASYQPSINGAYDEFPIYIGANEAPYFGIVGNYNAGLMKATFDTSVHDTNADFSRAIIGGSLTVATTKISIPWSGSNPPGFSTNRTGSVGTWTRNYD